MDLTIAQAFGLAIAFIYISASYPIWFMLLMRAADIAPFSKEDWLAIVFITPFAPAFLVVLTAYKLWLRLSLRDQ
jgi:hypothetical protein